MGEEGWSWEFFLTDVTFKGVSENVQQVKQGGGECIPDRLRGEEQYASVQWIDRLARA